MTTAPPPATIRDSSEDEPEQRRHGNRAPGTFVDTASRAPLAAAPGTFVDPADPARHGPAPGTFMDTPAPRVPGSPPGTVVDRTAAPAPASRVNLLPPLAERYDIEQDLEAAGGEADLLLCRERASGERRVVKLFRGRQARIDTAMHERVHRADPAHVVRVYEADNFQGYWWEVQEFVELGSLDDLAAREGRALPLGLVREVLVEMLTALEHFHTLDVVHRDIKPSNILVRARQPLDLVLADFGLAVVLASQKMRSSSRTSAYAAPEAAWGGVTAARDWWSLGITLLELIAGRHPFQTEDGSWFEEVQINAEIATRPIPLDGVDDGRWRHLLRGLLTRNPDLRWGPAQIHEWLAGGTPSVAEDETTSGDTSATARARPFVFAGRSHTTPASLAQHMSQEWKQAASIILGRDIDELEDWVHTFSPSPQLQRAIEASDLRKCVVSLS